MKNLSLLNKLIYFVNYIFAILLLFGFVLPYISPSVFPKLVVFSLTVPVLFIINILFVLYWLIQLKKQIILSAMCLLLGIFVSSPFFKISKKVTKSNNEITIMNYNVRIFNAYNWLKDKDIPTKIEEFVASEKPTILCVQEYHTKGENLFDFKYKHVVKSTTARNFGQAIYSNYKIVNKGSLNFKGTSNNAIFIDILKGLDTLRIYNLHMQSLGLNPEKEEITHKNSEKLINRLSQQFLKQQKQVAIVLDHQKKCNYPMIVSGDFNNTAYSWTYKNLKGNMHDSYLKSGDGFGKTFEINKFPMRIDFIFADKILQINEHKNYSVKYSDHYPIMARIGLD